jgi:hypothetical protein
VSVSFDHTQSQTENTTSSAISNNNATTIQQQFDAVFASSPVIEINKAPSSAQQEESGLSPPSPRKGLKPRSRAAQRPHANESELMHSSEGPSLSHSDSTPRASPLASGHNSINNNLPLPRDISTASPTTTSPHVNVNSAGIAIKRGMPLRLNNNKEPATRSLRKPAVADMKGAFGSSLFIYWEFIYLLLFPYLFRYFSSFC